MGGFCPLMELHQEGCAPAAYTAGLIVVNLWETSLPSLNKKHQRSNLRPYQKARGYLAWAELSQSADSSSAGAAVSRLALS